MRVAYSVNFCFSRLHIAACWLYLRCSGLNETCHESVDSGLKVLQIITAFAARLCRSVCFGSTLHTGSVHGGGTFEVSYQ